MGGGTYSYSTDRARKLDNARMLRTEIFRNSRLSSQMDVKNAIRECRDSHEHPEALPIIIALDVTGSMGGIPHRLITKDFPEIMKKIMDEGVAHPQVCFVGIGDHECDNAPFQAGQFESSDSLLDKWLKDIYLEGGGGGNDGESYQLAWWFAAKHVSADHIDNRHKKGILITIGDEPYLTETPKHALDGIFGPGAQSQNVSSLEMLEAASQNWDIYHINVPTFSGRRDKVKNMWRELLGDHLICTQSPTGDDVAMAIANVVIGSVKDAQTSVTEDVAQHKSAPTPQNAHIR